MDTQQHASQLIPDYVLGLLTAEERQRVEQHARQCAACRDAIWRERQIEALVRQSVQSTAAPHPGRLHSLRPAAPGRAARYRDQLYRQLAPVTVIVVLLMVGLLAQAGGLDTFRPAFAQTASPPTLTATLTHTPTATLAAAASETTTPAQAARLAPRTFDTSALPGPQVSPRPVGATAAPAPVATPIINYTR